MLRLWIVAAFALTVTAEAETRKIPQLTYETPQGVGTWIEKRSNDGASYELQLQRGEKKAAALIVVRTVENFTGDIKNAVDTIVAELEITRDKEPLIEREGVTTTGWPMAMVRVCCSAERLSIDYVTVGFNPPGVAVYAQLIMLEVKEDEDEDAIEAVFDRFVASFDFAGYGPRPAIPTPSGDGDLSGLYMHHEGKLQLNPMGGMDFVVDMTTYYFEPEGVFADRPPAGASTLAEYCASAPEDCGTYAVADGKIAMRSVTDYFGLVEVDEDTLENRDGQLIIAGQPFQSVAPADDLKLDGAWTHVFAQSGTIGTTSSSFSSVRTLKFTPDGRFHRSGFVGASSTTSGPDGTSGVTVGDDTDEETGAYTIDGYTLTLEKDDGTRDILSIYLPDPGDTDLIVINGSNYLKDGRKTD